MIGSLKMPYFSAPPSSTTRSTTTRLCHLQMTIPATLFDFFHRTNRATPVTIISHLQVYGCVSSFSDSRPAPHRGLFFAPKKESVEKSAPFIIPPDDLARLRSSRAGAPPFVVSNTSVPSATTKRGERRTLPRSRPQPVSRTQC